MYIIEGGENGFSSIPRSIYWAIVTMTTVGYGDIAPQTSLGQTLASIVMILGWNEKTKDRTTVPQSSHTGR
jgi:voltage-gated potassium channel